MKVVWNDIGPSEMSCGMTFLAQGRTASNPTEFSEKCRVVARKVVWHDFHRRLLRVFGPFRAPRDSFLGMSCGTTFPLLAGPFACACLLVPLALKFDFLSI